MTISAEILGHAIEQVRVSSASSVEILLDDGSTFEITAVADALGSAWLEFEHWKVAA